MPRRVGIVIMRGQPPAYEAALCETLARLSLFAAQHAGSLQSLDVNPLLVRPEGHGVLALDAALVRK